MTSRDRTARTFTIPSHWTPAQADAVFEFLAHIADQVFIAHHDALCRIAYRDAMGLPQVEYEPVQRAERTPAERDPRFDEDPIPF